MFDETLVVLVKHDMVALTLDVLQLHSLCQTLEYDPWIEALVSLLVIIYLDAEKHGIL